MIDTHCHLTDPRLLEQIDDVIARARAAGVGRIVTIGTDLADDRAAIGVCRRYANVRCVVGIHPNYSQDVDRSAVEELRSIQADPAVVALGEMGLDYFHNFAPREHQAEIFRAQLQLATELNRPVVIHSREAVMDTLAILREFPSVRAVFHSFTGTPDEARAIIDQGYLIGLTGPVTYKKNDALREVARFIPSDRLLLETDAPYLSPEPVRSQRTNEPAFVVHIARRVAQERGALLDELDAQTTSNAKRFFALPPLPLGEAG